MLGRRGSMIVAAGAGICLVVLVVGWVRGGYEPGARRRAVSGAARKDAAYTYAAADRAPENPRERLKASVAQWPSSPAERMHSMHDRLQRVADRLNAAAGAQCTVMLGQADQGASCTGRGIITADSAAVWQLSEDALACLIAREIGHEVLSYQDKLDRLRSDRTDPGGVQLRRALDEAADEFTGRLIARTAYQPAGMAEVLRRDRAAVAAGSPEYYPEQQRLAVFQRAYESARQSREAVTATRPAGSGNPQSARRTDQQRRNEEP